MPVGGSVEVCIMGVESEVWSMKKEAEKFFI